MPRAMPMSLCIFLTSLAAIICLSVIYKNACIGANASGESLVLETGNLAINQVTPNAGQVGKFELFELTIDLSATYDNPYDPDDIEIIGHFTSPSGDNLTIPGFYYQGYTRTLLGESEELDAQGTPCWKVRFAGSETGTWEYYVTARDRNGEVTSEAGTFIVTDSTNPGYIRRNQVENYHLEFDSGDPYFAVGLSIGWAGDAQTYDYDYYFAKLAQNRCNYTRVWMTDWNLALEWTSGHGRGDFYGLGRYSTQNAWRLDHILQQAEESGIYILLTMGNYGELMVENGPWNEQRWNVNPYNAANGGPCSSVNDFWTNENAKEYYKNRLRYITARWGYSTNIFAWEFWNEVDVQVGWAREMAQFVKQIDLSRHLVSNSVGYPWTGYYNESELWESTEIDFAQLHKYGWQGAKRDLVQEIITWCRQSTSAYDKPSLVAEFGIDSSRDDAYYDENGVGVHLHNGIWASTFSNSCGTAASWWWDTYIDPNELYHHYRALADFVDDIDWTGYVWQTAEIDVDSSNVRVIGLKADNEAILWVHNKDSDWYNLYHGVDPGNIDNLSFELQGMPDDNYVIQWWDTWEGKVIAEEEAQSIDGSLFVQVPTFDRDVALKIRPGNIAAGLDITYLILYLAVGGLGAYIGTLSYKLWRARRA